ncbi:hypothetical protein RYA05_35885 [Pseudomonas syringae pv. actinidiae]|nr:hypothetical protein [Pseudomonas syringae pv. actinidiae]
MRTSKSGARSRRVPFSWVTGAIFSGWIVAWAALSSTGGGAGFSAGFCAGCWAG